MQLSLFDNPNNELPAGNGKIAAEALFEAYFTCRKNKRNTYNALAFELDYEHNLVELMNKINCM
jgi:RNA-directed DNA polymerase